MIPAAALTQPMRRVSSAALAHIFLRSLFLQAAWNPRGMQNLGFADAIAPALDELYPDPAARAQATARQTTCPGSRGRVDHFLKMGKIVR